jgi:hypothetical protein
MKIDSASLAALADAIAPLDTPQARAQYVAGDFPCADTTQDVDFRYRWDLLTAARVDICALYDAGLNDTHIDSALRSIVAPLVAV